MSRLKRKTSCPANAIFCAAHRPAGPAPTTNTLFTPSSWENRERPPLSGRPFSDRATRAANLCHDGKSFFRKGLGGMCSSDVQHDAAIDFSGVHPLEDVVDVFERLSLGGGVDQTLSGESERLGEIKTRANDGAAN